MIDPFWYDRYLAVNSNGYLQLGGNIRNIYILILLSLLFGGYPAQSLSLSGFTYLSDYDLNDDYAIIGQDAHPVIIYQTDYPNWTKLETIIPDDVEIQQNGQIINSFGKSVAITKG